MSLPLATAAAPTEAMCLRHRLECSSRSAGRHQHEYHQITVTVGGAPTVRCWTGRDGEVSFAPRPGNITIIPASELHELAWSGTWIWVNFHVSREVMASAARELGVEAAVAPIYCGQDRLIFNLASTLASKMKHDYTACRLYAQSLERFLAVHLLRGLTDSRKPERSPCGLTKQGLQRVTDYIDSNIHCHISRADLANIVGLSPFHFCRCFKSSTGMTLSEFITRRRIELAKRLLSETRLPIVDISGQTGFASQSHLGLRFRQVVGVTPGQFRASVLGL